MIDWQEKNRQHTSNFIGDIIIRKSNSSHKNNDTAIRFKKGLSKRITNTQYIIIGFVGTRLYFKEATSEKGWKIVTSSGSEFTKISGRKLPLTKIEEGRYWLRFDREEKLYFIDISEKIRDDEPRFYYKGAQY